MSRRPRAPDARESVRRRLGGRVGARRGAAAPDAGRERAHRPDQGHRARGRRPAQPAERRHRPPLRSPGHRPLVGGAAAHGQRAGPGPTGSIIVGGQAGERFATTSSTCSGARHDGVVEYQLRDQGGITGGSRDPIRATPARGAQPDPRRRGAECDRCATRLRRPGSAHPSGPELALGRDSYDKLTSIRARAPKRPARRWTGLSGGRRREGHRFDRRQRKDGGDSAQVPDVAEDGRGGGPHRRRVWSAQGINDDIWARRQRPALATRKPLRRCSRIAAWRHRGRLQGGTRPPARSSRSPQRWIRSSPIPRLHAGAVGRIIGWREPLTAELEAKKGTPEAANREDVGERTEVLQNPETRRSASTSASDIETARDRLRPRVAAKMAARARRSDPDDSPRTGPNRAGPSVSRRSFVRCKEVEGEGSSWKHEWRPQHLRRSRRTMSLFDAEGSRTWSRCGRAQGELEPTRSRRHAKMAAVPAILRPHNAFDFRGIHRDQMASGQRVVRAMR